MSGVATTNGERERRSAGANTAPFNLPNDIHKYIRKRIEIEASDQLEALSVYGTFQQLVNFGYKRTAEDMDYKKFINNLVVMRFTSKETQAALRALNSKHRYM